MDQLVPRQERLHSALEPVEQHDEVGSLPVGMFGAPPTLRVVEERFRFRCDASRVDGRVAVQVAGRYVQVEMTGRENVGLFHFSNKLLGYFIT